MSTSILGADIDTESTQSVKNRTALYFSKAAQLHIPEMFVGIAPGVNLHNNFNGCKCFWDESGHTGAGVTHHARWPLSCNLLLFPSGCRREERRQERVTLVWRCSRQEMKHGGLLEDVWSMYMTSEPPSFIPSCLPSIVFPSYTLLLWMYHRTDFVEVKSFSRFGISDVLLIGFLCRQLLEIMCWKCSLPKIALISQTNGGCFLGEGATLPFGPPPQSLWKPSRSKVWPVRSEISSANWPFFMFVFFYTFPPRLDSVSIPTSVRIRLLPLFSQRELSSSGFFCLPFQFLPHDCISPSPSNASHLLTCTYYVW